MLGGRGHILEQDDLMIDKQAHVVFVRRTAGPNTDVENEKNPRVV
jgi:hypothetical protein